MPRYVIERDFGNVDEDEMLEIALLSKTTVEHFGDITWEHSHVVSDDRGSIKTFCIYEAPSEERVREHAARMGRHVVIQLYEIAGEIRPDEIRM